MLKIKANGPFTKYFVTAELKAVTVENINEYSANFFIFLIILSPFCFINIRNVNIKHINSAKAKPLIPAQKASFSSLSNFPTFRGEEYVL